MLPVNFPGSKFGYVCPKAALAWWNRFFRWIKQHLRIKAFFGTSENAVKTQVWIAISVYVLVAIIKKRLHLNQSLYTILQILSISVFEKEPLIQILTNYERSGLLPEPDNQLNLFN